MTIVTEKEFEDVNHSLRENEWEAGLHLPRSLIGHNKRSDHLRNSVFIQMYSQENYSTQCMMISRKGKFATERIESTVTGSIPLLLS